MKIYWNGTSKNIIGPKVRKLRTAQGLSQAALAGRLQLLGMECSDLAILRIEQGSRFVPDYEVAILSEYCTKPLTWQQVLKNFSKISQKSSSFCVYGVLLSYP